jgi:hypothetical protein
VGYRFQPERPGGPDEAAAFEAKLAEELPRDPETGQGGGRTVAVAAVGH